MADQLEQSEKWRALCNGAIALELGSGTGLVGLTAASVGRARYVMLTDKQLGVVSALEDTVAINQLDDVCEAAVLDWDVCHNETLQTEKQSFDLIIVADCMYSQNVTGSLSDALSTYCGDKTKVFFGYEQRWSSQECLEVLASKGWRFEEDTVASLGGVEMHVGELVRIHT
jgi:predicted nicotinamide N-methyase